MHMRRLRCERWLLSCAAGCSFAVGVYASDVESGVVRSFTSLTNGAYEVPLGEACSRDMAAEEALLRFLDLEKERDAAGTALLDLVNMDGRVIGSMPNEYRYAQALGRLNELLSLCRRTKDTEAGLTSVLILAAEAFGWEQALQTTAVEDALHRMATGFGDQWQSKVGVLIHSSLLIKKRSQDKEEALANAEKAIALLRTHLPPKEIGVEVSSLQLQAVSERFKVTLPLRGSFLVSILLAEYRLGNHGYPEYFSKAEATCKQVLEELPNTEFAELADDIANRRIPRLRQMMEAASKE